MVRGCKEGVTERPEEALGGDGCVRCLDCGGDAVHVDIRQSSPVTPVIMCLLFVSSTSIKLP